jgi:GTP diphosphokinase / guanosine-3',5'-bis(diphosphate) 3'-diphosphatase
MAGETASLEALSPVTEWTQVAMLMNVKLDEKPFDDFVRALGFASRKHSQQRRKDADASPYINHPIALVSILALEAGINDRDTLCAALLHDTIEDTDTSVEELVETFGAEVAALVQEVTDDKRLPKEERKQLQIEHAIHLSSKARLVKLADKIANLRDMADSPPAGWSLARRQEYFDWAKQVVERIADPPAQLLALFKASYQRRP